MSRSDNHIDVEALRPEGTEGSGPFGIDQETLSALNEVRPGISELHWCMFLLFIICNRCVACMVPRLLTSPPFTSRTSSCW